MHFNKTYFLIIFLISCLGATFFSYSIFSKEYRLVNIYGGGNASANLVDLEKKALFSNIQSKISLQSAIGLPVVDLFVPDKSHSVLNEDLPKNIKKWVPAQFRYPNGNYKEVKIRYRGDNFFNWAYQKKSYRIKLKKKQLIDSTRVFNYTFLSDKDALIRYLPYFIGKLVNLPTPNARLIELRVNGKPQGVYMEYDDIDEGFLRRNNYMPVNIYKGEQFHTGRDQEKGVELFNNPSLWTKGAIFNQRDSNDSSDLNSLINQIRISEGSVANFHNLKELADIDIWAKYDALQTLLQSSHNDDDHNMRIVSDVWRGSFHPIVYEMVCDVNNYRDIVFENPTNSLYKVLTKSSEFLSLKYKYLYEMLVAEVLSEASSHVNQLESRFYASFNRDIHKDLFRNSTSSSTNRDIQKDLYKISNRPSAPYEAGDFKEFANLLIEREQRLLTKLNKNLIPQWSQDKKTLSILVDGIVPIKDPVFTLSKKPTKPIKYYFDKDANGIISEEDLLLPVELDGNNLTIRAEFFANRVSYKNNYNYYPIQKIVATRFNIISDEEIEVLEGYVNHYFNGSEQKLYNGKAEGASPLKLNYPIVPEKDVLHFWEGVVEIDKNTIVENKVKILPGTEIILHKGVSLIFKNHVEAVGTSENKIKFVSKDNEIWGALSLVGEKTKNSTFDFVTIQGGSGYDSPNLRMVGMFSVHNTSNISLLNMEFSRNHIYDDLIHVVYSQNVLFKNCKISNSLFDAIDIDISTAIIDSCVIENSGNDGIDSMSSVVKVINSFINGSGDKGISIGEKSSVLVINSSITNNNIGIESKDLSTANISKSYFYGNKLAINAYKKNWQYGGGGLVNILDMPEAIPEDKITLDKHSLIYFYEGINKPYETNSTGFIFFDENLPYFIDNSKAKVLEFWSENI